MSFVVYHTQSTLIAPRYDARFATERAAKSARTRYCKKEGLSINDYSIADAKTFHESIEKQETKINLMSGKPFTQPVNTPGYCDPSRESYWSA